MSQSGTVLIAVRDGMLYWEHQGARAVAEQQRGDQVGAREILADEGQPLDRSHLFATRGRTERKVLELGRAGELVAPHRETPTDTATADALDEVGAWLHGKEAALDLPATLDRLSLAALARAKGNVAKAARQLGLTRAQLDYRIKKIQSRASVR